MDCSRKIYDSIWYPQSVIQFEMYFSGYDTSEYDFDRTPESIELTIKINAHNIDRDFDELVSKYNIKDDWKDFQKVLGLRDIEPGEKLKIIIPPAKNVTDNVVYNPNAELEIKNRERKVIHNATPVYRINETGSVVVRVIINRDGIVTEAIPGIKGTTNNNKELLETAKNAALQTLYNPDPNAPESQTETIRYNFRLSH